MEYLSAGSPTARQPRPANRLETCSWSYSGIGRLPLGNQESPLSGAPPPAPPAARLPVFVLMSFVLASKLSEANRLATAHEKMACRASIDSLRKKDADYIAVETALNKLVADPAKTIDTNFGPFLTAIFLHADIATDPDYARVLTPFVLSVSDFRAGSLTVDKLQSASDTLMVETKKADGKLRAILNATIPGGC